MGAVALVTQRSGSPSRAFTSPHAAGLKRSHPQGVGMYARQILPTDALAESTLTFLGLPTGTDIVVLLAGTSTVLLQVDAHPATSYPYVYPVYQGDTTVDVGFIRQGFEVQYVRGLTLPRTNAVLPIALRPDRNFI